MHVAGAAAVRQVLGVLQPQAAVDGGVAGVREQAAVERQHERAAAGVHGQAGVPGDLAEQQELAGGDLEVGRPAQSEVDPPLVRRQEGAAGLAHGAGDRQRRGAPIALDVVVAASAGRGDRDRVERGEPGDVVGRAGVGDARREDEAVAVGRSRMLHPVVGVAPVAARPRAVPRVRVGGAGGHPRGLRVRGRHAVGHRVGERLGARPSGLRRVRAAAEGRRGQVDGAVLRLIDDLDRQVRGVRVAVGERDRRRGAVPGLELTRGRGLDPRRVAHVRQRRVHGVRTAVGRRGPVALVQLVVAHRIRAGQLLAQSAVVRRRELFARERAIVDLDLVQIAWHVVALEIVAAEGERRLARVAAAVGRAVGLGVDGHTIDVESQLVGRLRHGHVRPLVHRQLVVEPEEQPPRVLVALDPAEQLVVLGEREPALLRSRATIPLTHERGVVRGAGVRPHPHLHGVLGRTGERDGFAVRSQEVPAAAGQGVAKAGNRVAAGPRGEHEDEGLVGGPAVLLGALLQAERAALGGVHPIVVDWQHGLRVEALDGAGGPQDGPAVALLRVEAGARVPAVHVAGPVVADRERLDEIRVVRVVRGDVDVTLHRQLVVADAGGAVGIDDADGEAVGTGHRGARHGQVRDPHRAHAGIGVGRRQRAGLHARADVDGAVPAQPAGAGGRATERAADGERAVGVEIGGPQEPGGVAGQAQLGEDQLQPRIRRTGERAAPLGDRPARVLLRAQRRAVGDGDVRRPRRGERRDAHEAGVHLHVSREPAEVVERDPAVALLDDRGVGADSGHRSGQAQHGVGLRRDRGRSSQRSVEAPGTGPRAGGRAPEVAGERHSVAGDGVSLSGDLDVAESQRPEIVGGSRGGVGREQQVVAVHRLARGVPVVGIGPLEPISQAGPREDSRPEDEVELGTVDAALHGEPATGDLIGEAGGVHHDGACSERAHAAGRGRYRPAAGHGAVEVRRVAGGRAVGRAQDDGHGLGERELAAGVEKVPAAAGVSGRTGGVTHVHDVVGVLGERDAVDGGQGADLIIGDTRADRAEVVGRTAVGRLAPYRPCPSQRTVDDNLGGDGARHGQRAARADAKRSGEVRRVAAQRQSDVVVLKASGAGERVGPLVGERVLGTEGVERRIGRECHAGERRQSTGVPEEHSAVLYVGRAGPGVGAAPSGQTRDPEAAGALLGERARVVRAGDHPVHLQVSVHHAHGERVRAVLGRGQGEVAGQRRGEPRMRQTRVLTQGDVARKSEVDPPRTRAVR